MILENVDFKRFPTARVKCMGFSQDGKSAVRRWLELYPIEVLTGVDETRGFYMEVKRDNSNFTDYIVWNDCDGKIAIKFFQAQEDRELSELSELLCKNAMYKGSEGYKRLLAQREANGGYINLVDIAAMSYLGEFDLAEHYQQYRKDYLQKKEQRDLEKRHQEELKQRQQEEEWQRALEAKLAEAEECIKGNRLVKNELLDDGKHVILCLMKKHGINVPLKTQGWINSKLVNVQFGESGDVSLQFYRHKGCKCSQSVYRYLRLLKEAVEEAV